MSSDHSHVPKPLRVAILDENDRPTIALPPPASGRGHQRSRTTVDLPPLISRTASSSPTRASNFLPFLRTSSRSVSPEQVSVNDAAEFDIAASSNGSIRQKPSGAVEKLASWFEGSSEPVNITLVPSPRKEKADFIQESETMDQIFTASSDSIDMLTRRPKRQSISGPANQSRFSLFKKTSQILQGQTPTDQDELAHLDIRDELFPEGLPEEYSPAAFKNLQLNAEGALRRFQSAHVEQQKLVRSLTSAKNVQSDELEAAQTRNEHLKLQLIEMAEKAAEQERLITALRTSTPVLPHTSLAMAPHHSIRMVSQDSVAREDLFSSRRPPYRRNRCSDISTSGDSEHGSEISSVVSVFSDVLSMADSPGTSVAGSPVMKHTTMQYDVAQIPVLDCQKCHGVRPSEAWDVISMMKLESAGLKERISELEGANDEALSFLSGLKIF